MGVCPGSHRVWAPGTAARALVTTLRALDGFDWRAIAGQAWPGAGPGTPAAGHPVNGGASAVDGTLYWARG
jgi:hypothetical protein